MQGVNLRRLVTIGEQKSKALIKWFDGQLAGFLLKYESILTQIYKGELTWKKTSPKSLLYNIYTVVIFTCTCKLYQCHVLTQKKIIFILEILVPHLLHWTIITPVSLSIKFLIWICIQGCIGTFTKGLNLFVNSVVSNINQTLNTGRTQINHFFFLNSCNGKTTSNINI